MTLKGPLTNVSGTLLGSEISIGPAGGCITGIAPSSHLFEARKRFLTIKEHKPPGDDALLFSQPLPIDIALAFNRRRRLSDAVAQKPAPRNPRDARNDKQLL